MNARRPQWETTSMEETSMEVDLNRRQPNQLCNELGPAQPQLVSPIIRYYHFTKIQGGFIKV